MSADTTEIVLENENIRAAFDGKTGALAGLTSKKTGWVIHRRSKLALSFRMQVPLPEQRANHVYGQAQAATSIEVDEDNSRIVFTWKDLESIHGGTLDIIFKGIVTLTDDGLAYEAEVENRSPYVIESVTWPCIGDLSVPPGAEKLERANIIYSQMKRGPLFPTFTSDMGYYGVDYPIQVVKTPETPFALTETGTEGLYTGYHDTTAEHMVSFTWELKPGFEYSENCQTGWVPTQDEIVGEPVRIEFCVVHFPFFAAGESGKLQQILLQPYVGTWHKGADSYKKWRKTWFTPPRTPDWVNEVHSWQQIHINSPEDELRCQYKDLVKYGEDCAKHGVTAIQLTGWTNLGQDRGNPSHDVDPRLGTTEDLRQAIAEIQKLGVKLILFNKYTWSDRSSQWFRDELVNYAVRDPYGDYNVDTGYAYQTPTQLARINLRRLVPMCMNCPDWISISRREFIKGIELGADGMLYDENQHHGQANYCFDPSHGHHVPAYVYSGDAPLAEALHEIADEVKPDYLFAGEACYDLEFRHYSISYFRMDVGHVPLQRYICPHEQMMAEVIGINDRNTVNRALMYRYIISYEPRNFKGRLDEMPMTMEYGRKVDALRKRYSDQLWKAEFLHTVGATVTVDGTEIDSYSVFHDEETGKRAVVVSNHEKNEVVVRVMLDGPAAPLQLASPEAPDACNTDGVVTIAAHSAVVIMEK